MSERQKYLEERVKNLEIQLHTLATILHDYAVGAVEINKVTRQEWEKLIKIMKEHREKHKIVEATISHRK